MKRRYEKPMLCVERYALTQAIAACSGVKIKVNSANGIAGKADVQADPDATDFMLSWAKIGGFLSGGVGCTIPMNGVTDSDGVCYHTSINTAFNS